MSLSLPAVTGREVLKALVSSGFVHVSTKGSHTKIVHPDGRTHGGGANAWWPRHPAGHNWARFFVKRG